MGNAATFSRPMDSAAVGVMLIATAGLTEACIVYVLGTAMPRARIARATILITRINPSSTSPAAHACRCQSSYGAIAYLKIISGRDAVGWFQPGLQKRLPNAVKSSGAVSPATRAKASNTAVRMPRYAAGTITVAIVFHLLAPRAIAP